MPRVDLSEAATEDLDDAYRWYEDQRVGLGDEFLAGVDRISTTPRLYPIVQGGIRRALLRRFPYGLFYRVQDGGILIVVVFHGKRDPVHWKSRR